MSEFLRYVLYELKNSLVLVLLAGVLAVAGLTVAFFIHKKKYNLLQICIIAIYVGYIMNRIFRWYKYRSCLSMLSILRQPRLLCKFKDSINLCGPL